MPFEVGDLGDKINDSALSHLLREELYRITHIHTRKYEMPKRIGFSSVSNIASISPQLDYIQTSNLQEIGTGFSQLECYKKISEIGTFGVGSTSISIGQLLNSLGNLRSSNITGSFQRYDSIIILTSSFKGRYTAHWKITRNIIKRKKNIDEIPDMIGDLAFQVIFDLSNGGITSRNWISFKYYTESLNSYHLYTYTKNIKDLERAKESCNQAINFERDYRAPLNLLGIIGICYIGERMLEEALASFNNIVYIDPQNAGGWVNKGYCLFRLGRHEEALECYNKATEIDPSNINTWNHRGLILINLGRYNEAINCFEEVISLYPKDAAAWNNKGAALNKLSKYDDAIQAFDMALSLRPNLADAWNNKGLALQQLTKYDEAIKAYDKAIEYSSEENAQIEM